MSAKSKMGTGVHLGRLGRHATIWFEARESGPPVVTMAIMDRLMEIIDSIAGHPDIRSVTLQSEGVGVFLAGGDLQEFATLDTPQKGRAMAMKMRRVLAALEALPCPVIAVLEGDVFGGGCETILAADIRIAVEGISLAFTQGRFGLITGWGGATRLSRRVGPSSALFLLTTGRPVSSEYAKTIRLVDKVVSRDGLDDYLAEIRANLELMSPEAIKAAKLAVQATQSLPFEECLDRELDLFTGLWASPQHREGLEAFFQKRAPSWANSDEKTEGEREDR
ncbi:MAG: enoyl-CoA hydratase/isomerase family protein [Deltaproteobacteria bacterium]|nr:enoyl-CoA hydratase/isomerase family protein [Deltaproteobacteria bacterium]